jgi:TRAP transporter 4TM/12TM fusion protein
VRQLTGYAGWVVGTVAVAMAVYHVWARLTTAPPDSWALRIVTLAFTLVLAFLLFPRASTSPRDRVSWADLGLAGASLVCVGYLFVHYEYISLRFPTAEPLATADMVIGAAAILLVLEATRRTIGLALPIVAGSFVVYALAGPWLPGALRHRGLTLEILIDQSYFTTEGIFGIPLAVAGSYVILFIVFGTFLEKSGAGSFFMNLANALAGGSRGGPGKVAVVSSSLFGTISGSAVANVMVTGMLTIPMMKRAGFKSPAAAAIEAVASTGGQIMPPIMGAAAFVMAEFMGVSYAQVMIAALIPATFYYGALFAAIHFNAMRTGLRGLPREELPLLGHILWRQGHLMLPLVIIFALLIQGFTASYAAMIATASVILLSWVRRETGITPWRTLEALRDGARQTIPVATATAAAGLVIGIILQLGLAIRFTGFLADVAAGSLIPALLITMVAGIILGTGMTTTAAYIMQAALLIPALIKIGVAPMAAHLFAFYFACLSAVTPPVALAVFAAATISGSNMWAAGWQAVKFAAAGFIVPFFFVYSPALLFDGTWAQVGVAVLTGSVGVVSLAAGLEGQCLRPATWLERVLFVAAAITLIKPTLYTDVVGFGLLGVALLLQRFRAAVPVPEHAESVT